MKDGSGKWTNLISTELTGINLFTDNFIEVRFLIAGRARSHFTVA
jgi:hypothetical protein